MYNQFWYFFFCFRGNHTSCKNRHDKSIDGYAFTEQNILQLLHVSPVADFVAYYNVTDASFEIFAAQKCATGSGVCQMEWNI